MHTIHSVLVRTTPAAIWNVLADVERWPTWTSTMLQIHPLTPGGLRVGARYRVVQPKLRPRIYEVTECTPHKAFTWIQKAPGATLVADHRFIAADSTGTELELSFATAGPLGGILGRVYGKVIAEYIATEARSLKDHCEAAARQGSALRA
jgi:Polyketide cyclase / dehydrase and lipid transport